MYEEFTLERGYIQGWPASPLILALAKGLLAERITRDPKVVVSTGKNNSKLNLLVD